jgi:hypothetical protein
MKWRVSVVASILRKNAKLEHDPFLSDVALWVSSGGDRDYAFRYLITREQTRLAQERQYALILRPILQERSLAPPSQITPAVKGQMAHSADSEFLPQLIGGPTNCIEIAAVCRPSLDRFF